MKWCCSTSAAKSRNAHRPNVHGPGFACMDAAAYIGVPAGGDARGVGRKPWASIEKTILPNDLETADEIFISSTTRELLPVISMEGYCLKPGPYPVRDQLQDAFTDYVQAYVAPRRSAPVGKLLKVMQLACPKCGTRDIRVSHRQTILEHVEALLGIYPLRCRRCQHPMEHQRVASRSLEICAVPALLPSGTDYLE